MEPRRPKHQQQPPLVVKPSELERALQLRESYDYALAQRDKAQEPQDEVFPPGTASAPIRVIHTHMSMVFLLPNRVYKLKKCVDFGFADFSTLYKRFQACMAEVQLNQRLAPHVYIGVVPVSMQRATRRVTVRCDDFWTPEKNQQLSYWFNDEYGEIVEWAVHMVRLPDDQSLLHHMDHDQLTQPMLAQVAAKLTAFHRDARRGPKIDPFGKEDVIRHNIDENFAQTETHVGVTVSEPVYDRIKQLTYAKLQELLPVIEARVANNYICDSHGDLRLEHIYLLPPDSQAAAGDAKDAQFVIIDCIEFNEQFRYGDPLSDAAFLMMDIYRKGRTDLARFFQQQYLLQADQDFPENQQLFAFYVAYRAVVRAKVGGFRVMDPTLSVVQREQETQRARCYWLVALDMLALPAERPALVLVGGLPASGKSNLARMLAQEEENGLYWIRADAIRKELAGIKIDIEAHDEVPGASEDDESALGKDAGSYEEGLYSSAMTQRTYDEILIRSIDLLRLGKRVIVDATFRDPIQRQRFINMAKTEGALFALIVCECDREITKGRLLARKNDLSDATWGVFEEMEKTWSLPEAQRLAECFVVNTEKEQELTLRRAKGFLRKIEVL